MKASLNDLHLLAPMLYVPADRPDLFSILSGQRDLGVCNVAVCLEDAVLPEKRKAAANNLVSVLESISSLPRPVFVRPANADALEWLLDSLPLQHIRGFILPKATVSEIHAWIDRTSGLYTVLPILESRDVLDYVGRRELAQACAAHPSQIPCARIGANDLLSLLRGLRRPRGYTIYDTPVGRVIDALIEEFSAHGIPLCGSVCDRMEEKDVFLREIEQDILRGLFAKTVITPKQGKIVWGAYCPDARDLQEARKLVGEDSPAVVQLNGNMLERTCHSNWARRLLWTESLYQQANEVSSFNKVNS
jgi:citrate lyase beta subunit